MIVEAEQRPLDVVGIERQGRVGDHLRDRSVDGEESLSERRRIGSLPLVAESQANELRRKVDPLDAEVRSVPVPAEPLGNLTLARIPIRPERLGAGGIAGDKCVGQRRANARDDHNPEDVGVEVGGGVSKNSLIIDVIRTGRSRELARDAGVDQNHAAHSAAVLGDIIGADSELFRDAGAHEARGRDVMGAEDVLGEAVPQSFHVARLARAGLAVHHLDHGRQQSHREQRHDGQDADDLQQGETTVAGSCRA